MGTLSKYDLSGAIGIEVALHEIVVALEPRFFLNMRPAKASIECSIGQHAYNLGKNLGSLPLSTV